MMARVPLALRNLTSDWRRLVRSISGIGFGVLLMLLQLGFLNAFLDSAVTLLDRLDGDIVLIGSTKFRFGVQATFTHRRLHEARGVPGVAAAAPLYAEWSKSVWKNPQDQRAYKVQVLAFDPDQPVFRLPELAAPLARLRERDTVMVDRRWRDFLGQAPEGTETELGRRRVRVAGTFPLGPDFTSDGTVLTSDRTFMAMFPTTRNGAAALPDVELAVIRVAPTAEVAAVRRALRQALPRDVEVLTKAEFIQLERRFHAEVSPIGPIFIFGAAAAFVIGSMIAYQILYTDLSDQLPQYATLKAMGYEDRQLALVVLRQSALTAVAGFVPAVLLGAVLFHLIGEKTLLPLTMTPLLLAGLFALALLMCLVASLAALRPLRAAQPGDLF